MLPKLALCCEHQPHGLTLNYPVCQKSCLSNSYAPAMVRSQLPKVKLHILSESWELYQQLPPGYTSKETKLENYFFPQKEKFSESSPSS